MFIKNTTGCKYLKKSLEIELSLLNILVLPYKDVHVFPSLPLSFIHSHLISKSASFLNGI